MGTNINFNKILGLKGGNSITLPSANTPSFSNVNSFEFDGVDEYFSGAGIYSEIDGLGNFAFSFWIKPTTLSGYRQILTIGTNSADYRNQQIQILIDSGKILVYVSSTSYYWRSTTSLTQDVWQHILVTRDGLRPINQKGKVFINGIDASSADNTRYWANNATSNSGLMIGRHNNGWASLFGGKIDEVAVYTQDMAPYISEIYGGGEGVDLNNLATAPQPTTWQRMGEGAAWNGSIWTMTDVNGGYINNSDNMVEANRTTDVPPNPFVNTLSTYFDGIDDRVEINNTFGNGYAELSISTWVKYNNNVATSNQYHPIVARQGSLGNSFILQNMRSGASSNGGELYFGVNTSNGTFNAFSGVVPSQNVWYNIVGTYDGSNVKIYIDGVLKATTSASGNINSNNTILYLGDSGYGGYSQILNGNLDEVSIYSRGLTQSEVTDIFGQGVPSDISSISDIEAYWRMGDGDTANTITDNVGSNNGTMVNMNASNFVADVPTLPFANTKSILLDGIDDFVDCGSTSYLQNLSEFSVSLWAKQPTATKTKCFISDWTYNNNGNFALETGVVFNGLTKLIFYIRELGGTVRIIGTTGYVFPENVWNHIVITFNSGTPNIYVNGTASNLSVPTLPTSLAYGNGTLEMGRFNGLGRYFNGILDEVSVFNSELSASDVTTIYNGGVPNDISSLSPLSWWRCGDNDTAQTLTDNGSASNDGTMTNFTTFSTDVPT